MTSRARATRTSVISLLSFKWLFVLAIPFLAFFLEARLNTTMLKRDIELGAVNAELKRLQESFDAYNVKIATLETLDRIEIEAPDLGLVPPQPNQIKTIYYVEGDPPVSPGAPPIEIAGGAGQASAPARSEDSSWSSNNNSKQGERTSPMARLREAIAAGFGSYSSRSW
ncbi:MAG: hypothetical protein NTZ09_09960 [Candidatus Hydrogenedentes bacterium]|nr:hypothetical protein [Candidatus Hydrogenedentota bacterium]